MEALSFTADGKELAGALATAAKACAKGKRALDALTRVRIAPAPGGVRVTGGDTAHYVSVDVPARVEGAGAALLPAKESHALAKGAKGPCAVAIEASGVARVGAAQLGARHADEYPSVPAPGAEAREASVDHTALVHVLERVAHAMSTDDTRPHIASALLERENGVLRAVATDGHRLIVAETLEAGPGFSVVVPARAVAFLLAAKIGERVTFAWSGAWLWASTERGTVAAQGADVVFPSYAQVVPQKQGECAFAIDRATLVAALKSLAWCLRGKDARVALHIDGNTLTITATDLDTRAEGKVECEVTRFGKVLKKPARVGFNARYLRELAEAATGATLTVHLSGELDPMRVDDAAGVTAVVMPMRL